jgi:hypothetical protein
LNFGFGYRQDFSKCTTFSYHSLISGFFPKKKHQMAQSSFPNAHWRGPRQTFKAGDILGNQPNRKSYYYIPPPHNDLLNNTPYAAKYGSNETCTNPFGYVIGSTPSFNDLQQKTPLKRNQIFDKRKQYGPYGY